MQQPSLNEQRIKELTDSDYRRLSHIQTEHEKFDADEQCPQCSGWKVQYTIFTKTVDEHGSWDRIEFARCFECGHEWESEAENGE